MDLVLNYLDGAFFDQFYSQAARHIVRITSPALSKNPAVLQVVAALNDRGNMFRQETSLFFICVFFAISIYFSVAGLSYVFIYDKEQMKHPKFLRNQVWQEIKVTADTWIPTSFLTSLWFLFEVRGYSKLYSDIDSNGGYLYLAASVPLFLFFTDGLIYWIHRGLHSRALYAPLHKLHHKWIVPTPFASHAFHPLDGYLQSLPYHFFVYLFPCHKVLYLVLFFLVNVWTVGIHDGVYFSQNGFVNGSANHTIHHLYFNYNYGQYFTIWDRIGGTYRMPTEEQYNRTVKMSQATLKQQSVAVDSFLDDMGLGESPKEE